MDASRAGDAATSDASVQQDASSNDAVDLFGELSVRLVAPVAASGSSAGKQGFTTIGGKLFDRLPPSALIWSSDASEGGCTLLKPSTPFCDPACEGEVCTSDNSCAPYATPRNAGTLTFKGLQDTEGKSELSVEPIVNSYTTPRDVSLPFPAFAEGDPISVSGAQAGLSLTATGIAPLTLSTETVALSDSTPVTLAWTAGNNQAARILVELDISHHGGTKGKIECDVADTGSLTIAGSLLGKLLDLGVAGFPSIKVSRVLTSSASVGAGEVSLRVYADVERQVQIPGVMSCSEPADCPVGKSCGSDLLCK